MTIDFFVHPEHADRCYGGYPNQEIYKAYLSRVIDTAKKSQYPILINGLYSDVFKELISKSNQVMSNSFAIYEDIHIDRGEVRKSDWNKFVKLLDGKKEEEMRIHGCNLGECTEGFAVQLFAYLHRNEYWNGDNKKEGLLRKYHQIKGDFLKSRIRYGVTLYPPFGISITAPKRILRYHGNITHQLIDDKTEIYGYLPKLS